MAHSGGGKEGRIRRFASSRAFPWVLTLAAIIIIAVMVLALLS